MPRGRRRQAQVQERRRPQRQRRAPQQEEQNVPDNRRNLRNTVRVEQNDQGQEENRATRGQKRPAADLEEAVDERLMQTEAGESNIIDFEQILRNSEIIPPKEPNVIAQGCGGANSIDTQYSGTPHHGPCTSNSMLSMIRVADDDLAAHVPTSLKQKIGKGEFVNLSLLLKGSVELSEFCSGSIFRLNSEGHIESSNKECKDKIQDIEKWTNAFIIYASIYLATHSDKVYEMLHYMFNIRECALRQVGFAWRTYDEQFRLRQAISPSPWSQIKNDLWWRCMQLPTTRNTSNNIGHTSITSNTNRYTCQDFNRGKCTWQNCKFPHICSQCSGPHPQVTCIKQGSLGTNQTGYSRGGQFHTPQRNSFRGRPFSRRGSYRGPRRN